MISLGSMPPTQGPSTAGSYSDEPPLVLDWGLGFERSATSLACAYWRSRCGTHKMPTRSDLDPVSMRKFASHIGLVEIRQADAPSPYFIRLAGSAWEQGYGRMSGRFIHEFLPANVLPSWRTVFDSVTQAVAPLRVGTVVHFQEKRWLTAELFVAPLGAQSVSMLFLAFDAWARV